MVTSKPTESIALAHCKPDKPAPMMASVGLIVYQLTETTLMHKR